MAITAVAVRILKTILVAILTEKFLINVTLLLAEWAVKRTSNELDDQLFKELKKALDTDPQRGRATINLYDDIKKG